MVEQATFLLQKLEFENMVMSMLIINPGLDQITRSYISYNLKNYPCPYPYPESLWLVLI